MRHPAAIEACRCSEETNETPGDETTDYGTVFFKLITVMNEGPTAMGNIVNGGIAEPGSHVAFKLVDGGRGLIVDMPRATKRSRSASTSSAARLTAPTAGRESRPGMESKLIGRVVVC